MKLLFDQNLSRHLPRLLQDIFPDSLHVRMIEMRRSGDTRIWEYAKEHDYIIVTKDIDFPEMSRSLGPYPKVIHITLPNCSTSDVEALLRERYGEIAELSGDDGNGLSSLP